MNKIFSFFRQSFKRMGLVESEAAAIEKSRALMDEKLRHKDSRMKPKPVRRADLRMNTRSHRKI